MHDKISQVLIGINVRLAVFTRISGVDSLAMAPVRQLVEQSVGIVHDYARELRPAMLDQLGLIPALQTYINEIPKRKGRQIHFTCSPGVGALDNDKRTVLYRVAQEALVNVSKHAQARNVGVSLRRARGRVCLEITDDGKAFDVDLLSSPSGAAASDSPACVNGWKWLMASSASPLHPGRAPPSAPSSPSAKPGRASSPPSVEPPIALNSPRHGKVLPVGFEPETKGL